MVREEIGNKENVGGKRICGFEVNKIMVCRYIVQLLWKRMI
jgi:hypothetical protein